MTTSELPATLNLEDRFLHISGAGECTHMPVTADLFPRLIDDPELSLGSVMGIIRIPEGASHWERHPAGPELLKLLDGDMAMEVEGPDGATLNTFGPGECCVVPAGLWHRGVARRPSRVLFLTPLAGAEVRERR